LVGKPEGRRPLGRPRRRWVDNIRMDLQEVGCGYMDWIGLGMWRVWARRGGCIGSWWGNRRERDHWGNIGIDGWIILGRIFSKVVTGGKVFMANYITDMQLYS